METELLFDWNSMHVSASDVIALMRKYRNAQLEVLFCYGGEVYRVGVDPSNSREPFFMDDQTYPSMIGFCSAAYIEGGFLLLDLQADLDVLAVNRKDPAAYFSA